MNDCQTRRIPAFEARPDCTRCILHKGARSPGLPTRISDLGDPGQPGRRALLFVGEAPGLTEDEAGSIFVGASGRFVHRVFTAYRGLGSLLPIYLANACRCRPSKNATPTVTQVKACRPWLVADIAALHEVYDEVIVLCMGASATESVLGCSLQRAFARQGEQVRVGGEGRPVRVFATFHPLNLLPGRDPNRAVAIKDHLRILHEYITTGRTTETEEADFPSPKIAPPLPAERIRRLSLDIETYGAVADEPVQTTFHPVKALHFDKPRSLVKTAAVAWREPDGTGRTAVFCMERKDHRDALRRFIDASDELVGMNLKFDILWLRAADPTFRRSPRQWTKVTDLSVINYLESEQRPERSLKDISLLLGVGRYDQATNLKHHRYASIHDIGLYRYNALDAWRTLRAVEILEARIDSAGGKGDKLSDFCRSWYSDLFWVSLLMEEWGITFDITKLDKLEFEAVLARALIWSEASTRYGLQLSGKGSQPHIQKLFLEAVEEAGLVGDNRIEVTPKQEQVSCSQANTSILLQHLPADGETAAKLRLHRAHQALSKLIDSYTVPMLHGSSKNPIGSRLVETDSWSGAKNGTTLQPLRRIGIAYPTWYYVPSRAESGVGGGTMQGRITSKGPACQTLPAVIKKTLTTRFCPGYLMDVDLNQIELRVAALLSGDPLMIREFEEDIDLHTETGLILASCMADWMDRKKVDSFRPKNWEGDPFTADELRSFEQNRELAVKSNPRWNLFRQMGKTTNFLIIYGGQGERLMATISEDLGVVLPGEVTSLVVSRTMARYPTLRAFQLQSIEEAKYHNKLSLPLTGQSRVFIGAPQVVERTYREEILNFRGQCVAANITLDFQRQVQKGLLKAGLRSRIGLNWYDAFFPEGPLCELEQVQEILASSFQNLPYYEGLCQYYGRKVRLEYGVNVLVIRRSEPRRASLSGRTR